MQHFRVNDIVDYHDIIGGEITSRDHKIKFIGKLCHGEKVAWITNKVGCVCLRALTKSKQEVASEDSKMYYQNSDGDLSGHSWTH